MSQLRTVLKYPGSKWRIANWIVEHMPPHKSYLEPFFGSGAVFFRKDPSRIETINDMDGDVVNLFRCIQKDVGKLAGLIETVPYARQEYEEAFTKKDEDPYEKAKRFLIRTWMGHGSRTCSRSGWKNDVAGRERSYAVNYWNRLPNWVMEIAARLKEVQIENRPAIDVIKKFNRPNVLIYADPPYLLSTRKMKKQYKYEMTDEEHIELLKALKNHSGPVILSGYDNPIYNAMLSDWKKDQIYTTAEKGVPRIETIWIKE